MSEKVIKDLLEIVNLLTGEVRDLRQRVHWQEAQIRALHTYAVAKIADLGGEDRQAAFDDIKKVHRDYYDQDISEIESKFPLIASDIDIRKSMPAEEQEWWYALDKYYPKQEDPI
ncbi:MAG TPA: hypothetical protein VH619_17500 [Verrucomicrobiae bacterium]|jgi:hypothetical protein|nr:hypothetical protein [Verrucomicrobiae bacterium]